jgi:hypothetical protein
MEEGCVSTNAKDFAEKLNKCLDESEAPALVRERASILSKLLDIPKQQAWSILEGHLLPEHSILQRIAVEFEVDVKWLCGK